MKTALIAFSHTFNSFVQLEISGVITLATSGYKCKGLGMQFLPVKFFIK